MLILLCLAGPDKDQTWVLDKPHIVVGRDPRVCDVALSDAQISRIHAEIAIDDARVVLRDGKSKNGILVNNFKVQTHCLMPGDRMVLGLTELVFLDDAVSLRVDFDDRSPRIRNTMPLQEAPRRVGLSVAEAEAPRPPADTTVTPFRGAAALPDADPAQIAKRLKNLSILYDLNNRLTQIRATDDLYSLIEKAVFEVFPAVERICLLRREDDRNGFLPAMARTRDAVGHRKFSVSSSIVQQAERMRMGILALDAREDLRFRSSDSLALHPIRSVMCVPLLHSGRMIGALYLDNQDQPGCFDEDDLALFTAFGNQVAVALQNSVLYETVQKAYHQSILALVNMMDSHDTYTTGHTRRTGQYALDIGLRMGLERDQIVRLKMAGQLHDIGKIGIDTKLMDKPGPLSGEEYRRVQKHVLLSEKILRPIEYLADVLPIIRGHHERFDGKGYPDGLRGEAIPLEARVLAAADALDAMTTQRAYNKPVSFREAIARCRQESGKQFDPQVVEALAQLAGPNEDFGGGGPQPTISDFA